MSRRKKAEGKVDETPYVTRTERTQTATTINKVGLRLAELPSESLDQLGLPEDLREAIDLCQRMKIRGRSRQKRLICQILRGEHHENITQRLEALEAEAKRNKRSSDGSTPG